MSAPPVPWHQPIVVTRHDDEAQPYITLSTPLPDRTLISDELLHLAHLGRLDGMHLTAPIDGNPEVMLHRAAHATDELGVDCVVGTLGPDGCGCWLGWLLHLEGRNISATYRIDNYSHSNAWRATRWPD